MAVFCAESLEYTDADLSNIRAHILTENCTHMEDGEVCDTCLKEEFIAMRATAKEAGDTDENAIQPESSEGIDNKVNADEHHEILSVPAESKEAYWISLRGFLDFLITGISFLVTLFAKYFVTAVVIY
jgi:hypothetical protein